MFKNIPNDSKRNFIVALYVIIAIIFTGFLPFLQPTGTILTIIGVAIAISLLQVWHYQPIAKTKPIFWIVFLALITIALTSFGLFSLPVSNFVYAIAMGAIALIIGLKEWM